MIRAYLLILALAVAWTLAVLALAAWFCPCLAEAARSIDIQARGEAMKDQGPFSRTVSSACPRPARMPGSAGLYVTTRP